MSDYWCGHKVYDPSDLERRFCVEDGLGYLTVTTTEHLPPERENQLTRVRGVLDRIPPREADFVELYFFRRLRQTAIADIFNVSQPTVCYRLQRAAARIKYLLDLPEVSITTMEEDLATILMDPIDIKIMMGMVDTTCQSEVAKQMGVTQGFVRHRFFRSLKKMEEVPEMSTYIQLFHHVAANLNILKEVQRAQWAEPVIHLVS